MSVNVEKLEKLERKMTLTLPVAEVQAEVEKRLKRMQRTMKMDGFRPGKVPMNVVAGQYGAAVNYEVINEQVGQAFYKAATEAELQVAGQPAISEKEPANESELQFEAVFEVLPEVQMKDLSGVEVEKVTASVDDAAIDRTIEILQKQRRTFSQRSKDEPAVDSDRVTIDFEGKIDGEVFAGGKAEDFQYIVGEGQMLQEFEDAVRGMKIGESKTFPLAFPADYHGKEVAGKTADFLVTVKKLEAAHLPEVNEEFVKQLGVAENTVEGLRKDIRTNLEREVKYRVLARNKNAVMEALLASGELDLPKATVQAEINNLIAGARADLKQRGLKDADKAPMPEDLFKDQAERRVRLGLIVADVVSKNELYATEEQIKAHVTDLASSYERPEDVIKWYTSDAQRLGEIQAVVTENNVVDFVLGKAKINEKTVTFEELMGQA